MLLPSTPIVRRRQDRPLRRPPEPPLPAKAVVVGATVAPDGLSCTLVFDRPLTLVGSPPYEMDGSVEFGGAAPSGVTLADPQTLVFTMEGAVDPGLPWEIHSQPPWLATPVMSPQDGKLQKFE
jgi:hypothetical protein